MFTFETSIDPKTGKEVVQVPIKGLALAEHPVYNKGTAFSLQERDEFDLEGIYPIAESSLELQKQKTYESFCTKNSNLEKYREFDLLGRQDLSYGGSGWFIQGIKRTNQGFGDKYRWG